MTGLYRPPARRGGRWSELLGKVPTLSPRTRRGVTLGTAVVVALSSGTNYVFSAYSPQLAARLHLTSTETNGVAIAGNLGLYLAGPFTGKLVDAKGPRLPLFLSSLLLLFGYGLVWRVFVSPPAPPSTLSSKAPLAFLIIGMFLTGMGSSGGLSASTNGVAKSFGPAHRGAVLALVIAGFGLSAFLWASLAHLLFSENTADFLLLLSLGTAFCIMLGVVGVKIVPPELDSRAVRREGYERVGSESVPPAHEVPNPWAEEEDAAKRGSEETIAVIDESNDEEGGEGKGQEELDIHGWALFRTPDMWLLLVIMGCCSGPGLLLINNLGTIITTLYEHHRLSSTSLSSLSSTSPLSLLSRLASSTSSDERSIRKLQASQVSLLSIFNCLGRLAAGVSSDYLRNRYGVNRGWFMAVVAGLFVVTQVVALTSVDEEGEVWRVVTVGGFAYGSLFGTAPVLVLEWFGVPHFSGSFGMINLAPVVSGQTFNLLFGRTYDSHVPPSTSPPGDDDHSHLCTLGKQCYLTAFKATLGATLVAFVLAVYVGYRRGRMADPRLAVLGEGVGGKDGRGRRGRGRVGRGRGRMSREERRSLSLGAEGGVSPFRDELDLPPAEERGFEDHETSIEGRLAP